MSVLLKTAALWTIPDVPTTYDSLRSSFWNIETFRGMAAIEVWRIFSLAFVGVCAGLFFASRTLSRKINFLASDLFLVAGFGFLGFWMQGWLDNHPPLRTFLPFLSSFVFGLNDFAFRFSSIFATSVFLLWLTRKMSKHLDVQTAIALSLLVILPPSIFHTTVLLEPSVYGFFGWSAILILLYEGLTENESEPIVNAALLIPIFALLRLPVFLMVVPVGIAFLIRPKTITKDAILKMAMGALLALGYVVAIAKFGNSAAAKTTGLDGIEQIFSDGRPIVTWLRNWGAPWIAVFLVALIAYFRSAVRVWFLAALFPVMFVLYNLTVDPGAWGIGRYQAEFVGGFWAFFVYSASFQIKNWNRRLAIAGLAVVILGSFTLEQIRRIGSDNYSNEGHASLISNMSIFPYREAIEFLERNDAETSFVIAGGVPSQYESFLWFYGYPLLEARVWLSQAYEFLRVQNSAPSFELLKQYFSERKIKYLVVQTGRRHERVTRVPSTFSMYEKIERNETAPLKLDLVQSYEAPWGGILRIYRIL